MSSAYVALGFPVHNGMSLEPPPPVVLAVSRDEAKLEAFAEGLQDKTQNTMRPGGASWPPVYVYEGRRYSSVNVIEAADLDGPQMVVTKRVLGPICGAPMSKGNVATPLCCEPPGHYPGTLHRGNGSCSHMTWRDSE